MSPTKGEQFAGVTVALDLDVTEDLRREGQAREAMRVVQDARKAAGLEVSDRIALGLEASGELAGAIESHRDTIAAETLAVDVSTRAVEDGVHREEAEVEGSTLVVTLAKRGRS